jgi:hypothetical protein
MNNTGRSIKNALGKYLDPFLVLGIFILFAIPIVSLFNLTPGYQPARHDDNVLGLADESTVTITANTVAGDGIVVEKFNQTSETSYSFQVRMLPHEEGIYRNTLFTATNGTDSEAQLNITSNFESIAPGTKVSIVVDEVKFVVLDTDGTTYPPSIYVMPGDTLIASIEIEDTSAVNFASGFSLDLTVEQ